MDTTHIYNSHPYQELFSHHLAHYYPLLIQFMTQLLTGGCLAPYQNFLEPFLHNLVSESSLPLQYRPSSPGRPRRTCKDQELLKI